MQWTKSLILILALVLSNIGGDVSAAPRTKDYCEQDELQSPLSHLASRIMGKILRWISLVSDLFPIGVVKKSPRPTDRAISPEVIDDPYNYDYFENFQYRD